MRWSYLYLGTAVGITLLTWTALRPYLGMTDGWPGTWDPFTPLGVGLVNTVLVLAAWSILAVFHLGTAPQGGPRVGGR
jgi:hypothetical protein